MKAMSMSKLLFILILDIHFYFCAKLPIGNNPYVKRLRSGDYIIISSTNITFMDESFSKVINSINFDYPIFSNTSDENEIEYVNIMSTTIEQFSKEDDSYIVVLVNKKIYFFSKNEHLLLNYSIDNYIDFSSPISFSIITYGHSENNYYFYVSYTTGNYIYFIKMIYDKNSNNITIKEPNSFNVTNQILSRLSSCDLMNYNNEKIITCFYGNSDIISLSKFKVNNNYDLVFFQTEDLKEKYDKNLKGKRFAIKTIPDDNALAICLVSGNTNNFIIYNISSNNLDNINCEYMSVNLVDMTIINIEYFYETKDILIGAIDYSSTLKTYNNFKLIYFNPKKNTEPRTSYLSELTMCNERRINFVLPPNKNEYYIFKDASCSSGEDNFFSLNQRLSPNITNTFPKELFCYNYYNYEKTSCIDYIPDGYYCNGTDLIMDKTIDKCHENCLYCNKGASPTNNNCLKCKSTGNIYLNLGNCVNECTNGNYIEDSVLKCKCSKNKKCKSCNEESNGVNLCISCNNEEGYYPKENDIERNDGYIDCYKNPENYYLYDNTTYKLCYESCKTCSGEGNSSDHNCNQCKEHYENKNDFNNDNNCYRICPFYYYFDNNKEYYCTEYKSCPKDYNKLIESKKRCIDECKNDNIYKYEYNNKCYSIDKCLNKTIVNLTIFKCELNCDNYYNYEKTDCLDSIPDGFYCNNTLEKTIDKCHENCQTCIQGPINSNNNCIKCPNDY